MELAHRSGELRSMKLTLCMKTMNLSMNWASNRS
ncbi:MAG: hypothetical protein ACLRYB_18335 [Segatella copri]